MDHSIQNNTLICSEDIIKSKNILFYSYKLNDNGISLHQLEDLDKTLYLIYSLRNIFLQIATMIFF